MEWECARGWEAVELEGARRRVCWESGLVWSNVDGWFWSWEFLRAGDCGLLLVELDANRYECCCASAGLEDAFGVWDYLFCLGIYFFGDSGGGAGIPAAGDGGDTFFCGGDFALFVDAVEGGAVAAVARVVGGVFDGVFDFSCGLWAFVLGGDAGAFGNCGGDAGYDSGIYGAIGDRFFANAEAYGAIGGGAFDRALWRGSFGRAVGELGRGADRPGWSGGDFDCGGELVVCELALAEIAIAGIEGDELRSADAGWGNFAGDRGGGIRGVSRVSFGGGFAGGVVVPGVFDCGRIDHGIYGVCLVDPS